MSMAHVGWLVGSEYSGVRESIDPFINTKPGQAGIYDNWREACKLCLYLKPRYTG